MEAMRHRKGGEPTAVNREAMTRMVVALTLTTLLGVIGFLAAGSVARSATETNATLSLRKTTIGQILVNSRGHTLYLFAKDRNGKSACGGSCARFWPPLLSQGKPTAGPGIRASLVGTTRRSNGSRQVTYNRHPSIPTRSTSALVRRRAKAFPRSAPDGTPSRPEEQRSSRLRRQEPPPRPPRVPPPTRRT